MVCRRSTLIALAFLVGSGFQRGVVAQEHFTTCVSITGSSATIVLPVSAAPSLNGSPLAAGAEIAVFTEDDLCAGVAVWDGRNLSITAWGDDSVTESKDGFEPDEALIFRLWDASMGSEASDVQVAYSGDQPFFRTRGTFQENAVYAIRAFAATTGSAALPATPVAVEPVRGASGVARETRLKWRPVDGAKSYRIQVATDDQFKYLLSDEVGVTDTTYTLESLAPAATYAWRVRAEGEAGPSHFTPTRTFTTLSQPGANTPPVLLTSPQVRTRVGRSYEYQIQAGDAEGDNIRLEVVSLPQWLTFSSNRGRGTISGTPKTAQMGEHSVRLRAVDAYGARTNQQYTLTVVDPAHNTAPRAVVRVPRMELSPGGSERGTRIATIFEDEEGDALRYSAYSSNEGIVQVAIENEVLAFTAVSPGTALVELFAEDEFGAKTGTSFEFAVVLPAANEPAVPGGFSLAPNYPNPFNPTTMIGFTLDASEHVTLEVHDMLGRRVAVVAEGIHSAGTHAVKFDASGLSGGVYAYRLRAGTRSAVRTLVVLK